MAGFQQRTAARYQLRVGLSTRISAKNGNENYPAGKAGFRACRSQFGYNMARGTWPNH